MEEFINTILRAIFEFDVGSEDLASSMIFSQKEVAFVGQIWDILRIVAVAATIVYFMLEANRVWALEARDLNIKGFMAPFLKLVIALFVIKYSGYLVSLALNFSNSIVGQVSKIKIGNSGTNAADYADPVMEALGKLGFLVLIFVGIIGILFWLVSLIIKLAFQYKILVWKFKFILRICVTPIAFADVYSGNNSNAARWVKGLFAMGLYAACILLIPKIGGVFMDSWMAIVFQGNWKASIASILRVVAGTIIVPIAELGAISAAEQITKEVVGA